jgi:hypothetical protein
MVTPPNLLLLLLGCYSTVVPSSPGRRAYLLPPPPPLLSWRSAVVQHEERENSALPARGKGSGGSGEQCRGSAAAQVSKGLISLPCARGRIGPGLRSTFQLIFSVFATLCGGGR